MLRNVFQYFAFLVILIGFAYFMYLQYQPQILSWFVDSSHEVRIYVADRPLTVTIADSTIERRDGLSGVRELGRYEGKLFLFNEAAKHGMWMKDMLISIDILWFDESKRLIHYEERVSPDTYPKIFAPTQAAKYVLELRAGAVDDLNISTGDILDVPPVYLEQVVE